ncbi:MAG: hypothetical protein JF603_07730 [Acidobacteria bacterium]|nr:hypothetical protein [Acidobacteriota bacterium]
MLWQDFAIAGSQCILALSLIPILKSKTEKPPLSTAFLNASIVSFLTVVVGTLGLWIAMVTAGVIAALWWVIFVQKLALVRSAAARQPESPLELVGDLIGD